VGVRARVEVGVADWQLARGLIADGERTAAQAIAVLEAAKRSAAEGRRVDVG
jgi:hypothetical protein